MNKECNWVIRPGTHNSYWAFTPCKSGFNYLSKVHGTKNPKTDIKDAYDDRICPICSKTIKCNVELLDDVIELEKENNNE